MEGQKRKRLQGKVKGVVGEERKEWKDRKGKGFKVK